MRVFVVVGAVFPPQRVCLEIHCNSPGSVPTRNRNWTRELDHRQHYLGSWIHQENSQLLESTSQNTVQIIEFCHSTISHFIPYYIMFGSSWTRHLFIPVVVGHLWLPLAIVSYRGPHCTSLFQQPLCKQLGIYKRIWRSFHTRTDG